MQIIFPNGLRWTEEILHHSRNLIHTVDGIQDGAKTPSIHSLHWVAVKDLNLSHYCENHINYCLYMYILIYLCISTPFMTKKGRLVSWGAVTRWRSIPIQGPCRDTVYMSYDLNS